VTENLITSTLAAQICADSLIIATVACVDHHIEAKTFQASLLVVDGKSCTHISADSAAQSQNTAVNPQPPLMTLTVTNAAIETA
jgi:hypothetical protein